MRQGQPAPRALRATPTIVGGPRSAAVLALMTLALIAGSAGPAGAAQPFGSRAPGETGGHAVAGVTVDVSGRALPGVEIRLAPVGSLPSANHVVRALSDDKGRFSLDRLAPGAYRLIAVKGGYAVLIGQINTLVQDTVEIILRPAGAPREPGARPEDSGWALRLPQRDVLEDREYEARGAGQDSLAPARIALAVAPSITVEAGLSRVGGASDLASSNSGRLFSLDSTLMTAERGTVSGRFAHRDEGAVDDTTDRADGLRLNWLPRPSDDGRFYSIALDALQRSSEYDGTAASSRLAISGLNWEARRSVETAGYSSEVRVQLGLLSVADDGDSENLASNVARFAAVATSARSAGAHQFAYGASVAAVRGALRGTDATGLPHVAVMPFSPAEGPSGLAGDLGDRASAFLADAWQVAPDLVIESRMRADWNRGYDGSLLGTAAAGARFNVTPSTMVHVEAGLTGGGTRGSAPVGLVEIAGTHDAFRWSAARYREIGPPTWSAALASPPVDPLVLSGPEAQVDRWLASIAWRASNELPEVRVEAEWLAIDGEFTPHLPGDIAVLPVLAHARSNTQRVELALALARTGTSMSLQRSMMDDRGGALAALEGASRWIRDVVAVRQRVGSLLDSRAACFIVFAAETNRLGSVQQPAGADPIRTALLERRRFSGGMAVTF